MTTNDQLATTEPRKKNPHAVALGRLGGLRGGPARAKALTPERRKEISRMGVNARKAQQIPLENNPKIIAQST